MKFFGLISTLNTGATSSEFTRWGLGIVQEIDAAALSLWLKYREHHVSIEGPALDGIDDSRHLSVGSEPVGAAELLRVPMGLERIHLPMAEMTQGALDLG